MTLIPPSAEQPAAEALITATGGVVYRWKRTGLELLLIKKQGGFWTLPKGHIKPGESEPESVAREVSEETGISGDVGPVVKQVRYSIQKGGRPRTKVVTYYVIRAKRGSLRPDSKERIQRVRWFPVEAALKRIRRGRVRRVVQAAREMLVDAKKQPPSETARPPTEERS